MSTTPPRQPEPRPRPPRQPPKRPSEIYGPPPRRPSQAPPAPDGVITKQTLLASVLLTAIIATLLSATTFAMVIDKGSEGPVGPRGSTGPAGEKGDKGPRGRTNRDVTPAAVAKAFKADPDVIEDALQESTGSGFSDGGTDTSTDDFDSGSTDSSGDVEELRDEIQQVCDALRSSGSVTTDDLPC